MKWIMRPNGETIRDLIIMVIMMGDISAHSFKDKDFKLGTPNVSLINTRVSIVG